MNQPNQELHDFLTNLFFQSYKTNVFLAHQMSKMRTVLMAIKKMDEDYIEIRESCRKNDNRTTHITAYTAAARLLDGIIDDAQEQADIILALSDQYRLERDQLKQKPSPPKGEQPPCS